MKRAEVICQYRNRRDFERATLSVKGYECEIEGIKFIVHRCDRLLSGYADPGWGVTDPVTGAAVLLSPARTRALAIEEAAKRIKKQGGLPAVEKARTKFLELWPALGPAPSTEGES